MFFYIILILLQWYGCSILEKLHYLNFYGLQIPLTTNSECSKNTELTKIPSKRSRWSVVTTNKLMLHWPASPFHLLSISFSQQQKNLIHNHDLSPSEKLILLKCV